MHVQSLLNYSFSLSNMEICDFLVMVGEMVQNSQRLYSFTFSAIIIIIDQYIHSHSATKFLFKKYIYSRIYSYIYGMYLFTFTIEILVQHGAIFIQHFLRTPFAHH